jgi:hypothetical protein
MRWDFVGRADELAALEAAWLAAEGDGPAAEDAERVRERVVASVQELLHAARDREAMASALEASRE